MVLRTFLLLSLLISTGYSSADIAKDYIIGIDLGTTYSCVGVFKNGRVEILQNEQGNRITPSYVAFTPTGERLVGDSAKNQLTVNPTNTVFDAKRLIGREFSDPSVQKDIKMWPFKVINSGGKPKVELTILNEKKIFTPEEISAMVLAKMKLIAEERLQVNVTNAVVTVPAYFNDAQRQSTKDAGTIAGLNILRIINEPTAAAIAYGMNKKEEEKNILVFDLGGGTFDVSILTIDNGVFEVISTNGDTHLGGEDFDQRVAHYVAAEIKKAKGLDIMKDQRLIQKVRREVEKAKRSLSKHHETTVDVDLGDEKGEFSLTLTRAKFEELNNDLFRSTLIPLESALKDSQLTKDQIDEIILVGGSTRIPRIQQLVKQFFNGKEPNRGVNPDEAVAFGAAVQGGILSGDEETSGLVLLDVNALTLGVEVAGGTVQAIIKRNSKIPTKQTQIFTTVVDNQPRVQINIYEGERPMAQDNNKLGSFELTGIPPAARGVPQIEVTFELDHNGIIHVSAQDKGSGRQNKITITNEQRQLKQEEIERMIEEAEKYASDDQAAAEKAKTRSDFESSVYNLKNQLTDEKGLKDKLPEEDKAIVDEAINNAISWLDKNHDAKTEELKEKKTEFDNAIQPIMAKLYQQTGGVPPPQEGEPKAEL